jgi:hypothetical protein
VCIKNNKRLITPAIPKIYSRGFAKLARICIESILYPIAIKPIWIAATAVKNHTTLNSTFTTGDLIITSPLIRIWKYLTKEYTKTIFLLKDFTK